MVFREKRVIFFKDVTSDKITTCQWIALPPQVYRKQTGVCRLCKTKRTLNFGRDVGWRIDLRGVTERGDGMLQIHYYAYTEPLKSE